MSRPRSASFRLYSSAPDSNRHGNYLPTILCFGRQLFTHVRLIKLRTQSSIVKTHRPPTYRKGAFRMLPSVDVGSRISEVDDQISKAWQELHIGFCLSPRAGLGPEGRAPPLPSGLTYGPVPLPPPCLSARWQSCRFPPLPDRPSWLNHEERTRRLHFR